MSKQQTAMEFHLRELLAATHAHAVRVGVEKTSHKIEALAIEERAQKFLADYGSIPVKLNGYSVLAVLPIQHATPREHREYAVLVDRPEHEAHRYVVAIWRAPFGDSWDCGSYTSELAEALAALIARAKLEQFAQPQRPHDEGSAPPQGFKRYQIELDAPIDVDPSDLLSQAQQFAVDVIDNAETEGFEHPGPRVIDEIENRVSVQPMEG